MASEKDWAASLQRRLDLELRACGIDGWTTRVDAGERLAYAHEILRYDKAGPAHCHTPGYQTDLLVYDIRDNDDWIPRVVVECKLGVTTHDALTYSTKAATHKQVHPYLRYGIWIGGFNRALPARLLRHGAYFDFIGVSTTLNPVGGDWNDFVEVVKQELTT